MIAAIERLTGVQWKGQGPAFLVASGHAATHWILATFYVLLPFITKDLGLSYTEAGGLVTVFHVASFAANAGSGAVVDITGRRVRIQAAALVIGAGAFIGVGMADGVWLLVAMIVIIGVTNNLWHPAAISYLSEKYPANRGYALSVHTLGASLGDTVAPLAAGALLVWFTWPTTATLGSLPVFCVAAALVVLLGGGGKRERTGAAGAGAMGFGDYLVGVVGLLKNRAVLGVCVMSAFRSMTQNGLFLFLPLFMVDELGFGSVLLGLALTVLQLGGFIAGPVAGVMSDRIGRQPVVLISMAATTAAVVALAVVGDAWLFVAVIAVLGFALFAVRPVIHSWALDLTPAEMGGSTISLLFGTQSALSALVPVAGGMIADRWGLAVVFYVLAACVLVSTAMAAVLPDPSRGAKA
ncbi:MAG: MFS transporter [Magnetovibrio sp.]|nr:MFS transporter [Magnetovibrio sp.]